MDRQDVEDRLTRIHALFAEGYARKALGLARAAKEELLADEAADPALLGWLRYYELRSLHALGAWAEAVELFRHPERRPFSVPLVNAAWMHSAAAEGAARLGRAEDVVRWMERCHELRRAAGDVEGAAAALTTACALLERMGRPELNTPFADRLIELGLRTGVEEAVIQGVMRLLDNYEAKARTTIRRRLQKGKTLLPAMRGGRRMERAMERLRDLGVE
jgi:hypothetical protein